MTLELNKKLREALRPVEEHIMDAEEMARKIYTRPSWQHSEMIERIREVLTKMHQKEIERLER